MIRLTPLGQQGLGLLLRLQRLHGDGVLRGGLGVPMGGEAVPVDELLKLQLQQQVIELRDKGAAEVVLRGEVQRGIGDNGGQIPGVLGALPALLQLFDDAGLGVDLRQQAVQLRHGMILLHQRHGGLFPHAGDAGDVVGGVAHEGLQVDHVDGGEAVLLPEGLLRYILGGGLAHTGGHQLHLGVGGNELEAVLVAGDDDAVPAGCLAAAADGADEIVGLVAGEVVLGNVHGGEHLLQIRQLHGQLLRHPLALGLVAFIRLMAEGGLPAVEGDAQRLRLLLVQQPLEGGEKAIDRMGIQPVPCGQGADAIIGPVDDAVAVDDHQFHGGSSLYFLTYSTSLYASFAHKTTSAVERDRGFPVFCMEWGGKEGEFVFPLSFSGEIRYNLYLTEI